MSKSGKASKKNEFERLRAKSFEELVEIARKRSLPPGFITKIRFPHYRNMESDAELAFQFPVSVFTGPNGCGKTSVLQALYGAPGDYSVGRYWFSTDVDPIADAPDGKRPSFVYEYLAQDGRLLQPIKTRIKKKFSPTLLRALKREKQTNPEKIYDPNYWEPSRPLAWAGQTPRSDGSRDPTVERDVIYLHFRTQLSAFEAAFYGSGPPTTERREWLRIKSRYLLRALDGLQVLKPRGKHQSKNVVQISGDWIKQVNDVVGKEYVGAQTIEHKLFGFDWGESVRFQLTDATYSDAFAGSGEGAVFRLVRALQEAKEGTLVVLDEPEISLHPEAQTRMKHLLLAYAIHKKLQIFLATHSSHFVDGLPEAAVFLFQRSPSGKFLARNVPSELAMVSIGHQLSKRTIVVEDSLSKRMVERAMVEVGATQLFEIKVAPGGVSAALAALANDATENVLVLLDGDQRSSDDALDRARQLLNRNNVTRQDWDKIILELTRKNVPIFHQSGDSSSGHAAISEAETVRRNFVQAVLSRVHYLPGNGAPEDLLVTVDALNACFSSCGLTQAEQIIQSTNGNKQALVETARRLKMSMETVTDMLLARWASSTGEGCDELKNLLRNLISRGEVG